MHLSLWRQSQLASIGGLFEVVPGIYQVRGLDLSNVTFVEGDEGVVVIDTLLSVETGAAALALYRKHRGDRPGRRWSSPTPTPTTSAGEGFVSADEIASGAVRLIAPRGLRGALRLREHLRRHRDEPAGGLHVRRSPGSRSARSGRCGTGQTVSTGTVSLLARPTSSPRPGTRRSWTACGWCSRWRRTPRPRRSS